MGYPVSTATQPMTCEICAAAVYVGLMGLHLQWHEKLREAIDGPPKCKNYYCTKEDCVYEIWKRKQRS